jgi:hypothetical protein
MSTPEKNQQLASEVARIKTLALQRSKRANRTVGISIIGCVMLGLVAWFIWKPKDSDDIGLLVLMCSLPFFLVGLLTRVLLPIPSAECPQCGSDWNLETENDVQKWVMWRSCPRCGLRMDDDSGRQEQS